MFTVTLPNLDVLPIASEEESPYSRMSESVIPASQGAMIHQEVYESSSSSPAMDHDDDCSDLTVMPSDIEWDSSCERSLWDPSTLVPPDTCGQLPPLPINTEDSVVLCASPIAYDCYSSVFPEDSAMDISPPKSPCGHLEENCHIVNIESSDCSDMGSCDSTSSSSSSSSTDTDSDTDCGDDKDDSCSNSNFSEKQDIQSTILSCFLKHNMSAAASKDMLALVKKYNSESAILRDITFDTLWDIAGKASTQEVHYCEICSRVFPDDLEEFVCTSPNCDGLRYLGELSQQKEKGRRPRKLFVFADVAKQLINILQNEGKNSN